MKLQIPFIASIGYKKQINQYCLTLKEKTGLDYFVVYCVFNNGKKFVLSNIYHMLKPYYQESFYLKDFSVSHETIQNKDFYLCNSLHSVSADFANILEQRFCVYRTFYTVKRSPECYFVFGGALNQRCDNIAHFYNTSKNDFDAFCFSFMQNALPIIKLHNQEYQKSLILNDENYLKNIILNREQKKVSLSNRELECLIWAGNGKTSEDTALILKLSTETVNHHRRSILSKLNCKSLPQAIYKAIYTGIIGNLFQMNSEYFIAKQGNDDLLKGYNNVIVRMG